MNAQASSSLLEETDKAHSADFRIFGRKTIIRTFFLLQTGSLLLHLCCKCFSISIKYRNIPLVVLQVFNTCTILKLEVLFYVLTKFCSFQIEMNWIQIVLNMYKKYQTKAYFYTFLNRIFSCSTKNVISVKFVF